jgi:streptogramin lyase
LVTTQHGPVGYAVNGDSGAVVRIDPRTFVPSPPVRVLDRTSGRVSARATGSAVNVVDEEQGRVAIANPRDATHREGRVQSLAEPVASSTVDDDGRLWLLGSSSGDLAWFAGAERHDRAAAVAHAEGIVLVVARGSPLVVDPAARIVRRLTDGGGPVATCARTSPRAMPRSTSAGRRPDAGVLDLG